MFVENMRDGAATVSPAGLILYANRRLAELLSCSREQILGSPIAQFLAPDALGAWDDIRGADGSGVAVETELVDAAGERTVVLIGASPLEGDGGQLTCLTFTDDTARRRGGPRGASPGGRFGGPPSAFLDPELLHLELTETAIMSLGSNIVQQLHAVRDLGVQIGLDDFGTGYASLTHLRRLQLAFVKIDQSFVQGLGTDQEDDRIVAAVVDLASNLGLRSIAEGVETQSQLARLRELGCDQAQGYHFARPMAADAVPTTLVLPNETVGCGSSATGMRPPRNAAMFQ